MKENKYAKFIWGGIVLGVLCMVCPFKNNIKPVNVQKEIHKIDSINTVIKLRIDTIKQIDKNISKLESFHDSIEMLRRTIKIYESKIKEQNEKANNVSVLNSDELIQFITNRYKDSITSK